MIVEKKGIGDGSYTDVILLRIYEGDSIYKSDT